MSQNEISLDAFQTLIESKLRQPYTSLELPKCLQSSSLSPKVFIQYLQKCFRKMTKPIQLRCIIGLLGFEPDMINQYGQHESKEEFEESVKEFLGDENDEKWVRVMNGIIQEKMFHNDQSDEIGGNDALDSILSSAVDEIIHNVTEASAHAFAFRNEAKATLNASNDKNEQEIERLIDLFQIGKDVKPYFVPSGYRLCDSAIIMEVFPTLNNSCDFTLNEEAHILKEDDIADRTKAEEEKRLLEQEERLKIMAEERRKKMAAEAVSRNGNNNDVEQNSTSESESKGTDTASLMMRSKINRNQRGSDHPSISKNLAGTSASGMKGRSAGLGRGAAADAIGGRALGNPMSRTLGRGGMLLSVSSAIKRSGASMSGVKGRTTMKNTKMRMIDISEVEGLKKAEEERKNQMNNEDSRESRKRKILENAAAKGLKAKKGWADSTSKDGETGMDTTNHSSDKDDH